MIFIIDMPKAPLKITNSPATTKNTKLCSKYKELANSLETIQRIFYSLLCYAALYNFINYNSLLILINTHSGTNCKLIFKRHSIILWFLIFYFVSVETETDIPRSTNVYYF